MVAALVCNLSLGDEGPNIQGHSWIGGTNLKKKKKKKMKERKEKIKGQIRWLPHEIPALRRS